MPPLATVFSRLARAQSQLSPGDLNEIERYVVLLYHRTSSLSHVNEARKQLFAQNRNMEEHIPTTWHALEQHVKRAVYQAGHIWGQSIMGEPEVISPDSWCWKRVTYDSSLIPCWTTLPEAAKSCQELLKCGCKKACTKRCKYVKANLEYTQLCFCSEQCSQSRIHAVVLLLRTVQPRMRAELWLNM